MIRLLLTIFAVGLVVSTICWAGVMALGGPRSWTFSGNGSDWSAHPWDDDSYDAGPDITRELAWSGGDSLVFDVPAVVRYTQGPAVKITADGPANWVNKLVVRGDRVTMDGSIRMRSRNNHGLTLTISAPSVSRFELNSAQKLTIDNYAQDDLNIQSNGAAQINAHGSAKHLKLQMNGAGQANLGRLVNDDADVELNGASQATLAATDRADVEINGVGQAKLLHQPKSFHHEVHGFGSVRVDEDADIDGEDDSDAGKASTPATPATPLPLPGAAKPAKPAKPAHKAKAQPEAA